MSNLEDRVHRLERTLARLAGGAVVAAIAILAFFGVTHFHQIPKEVNKVIGSVVEAHVAKLDADLATLKKRTEEAKKNALEVEGWLNRLRAQGVRVQTGTVDINGNDYPDIHEANCRPNPQEPIRYRGRRGKREKFPTPFASIPEVIMALSYIDTMTDDRLHIMTQVTHVDTKGFNYHLAIWCDTKLWRGGASWMAVAQ